MLVPVVVVLLVPLVFAVAVCAVSPHVQTAPGVVLATVIVVVPLFTIWLLAGVRPDPVGAAGVAARTKNIIPAPFPLGCSIMALHTMLMPLVLWLVKSVMVWI